MCRSGSTHRGTEPPSYRTHGSRRSFFVGGGSVRRSSAHVPIGVNPIGGRSPLLQDAWITPVFFEEAAVRRSSAHVPIGVNPSGDGAPSYRTHGSRRSFFVGGGSVRRSSAHVPIGVNPSGDGAPSYSNTRSDPSVVGGGASELAIVFRKPDQSLNRRPQRTRRIRDPLTLS